MSAMPLSGTWPVLPVWLGRYRLPSDCRSRQALGLGDQHHAILIGLVEDGRDDALAERVVQRVVDGRRSDAIARGQLPVDFDVDAQPLVVQIAGDVGDRLDLLHPRDQLGHVFLKVLLARPPQHELILVRRHRGVEREVLLGLQVQLDAGHAGDLLVQAPGDLRRGERAIVVRPQIDQEAAVVQRRVGAVDADVRGQRGHVGILEDRIRERHLARRHRLVGHRIVGHADALDHADVLHREQALWEW